MAHGSSTPFAHAVLWYGRVVRFDDPLVTKLITAAKIQAADCISLTGTTMTVAELKALRAFAATSPHSSQAKLIILTATDELSPVVGNGLLKLLEEPPPYLLFRLSAVRLMAVLPTIRSRCQTVFAGTAAVTDDRYDIAKLRVMSLTNLFAVAETLAKDDALPAIVTHWLSQLEAELLQGSPVTARIASGLQLLERLRSTINRRLALESWLLSLYQEHRTGS